MNNLILAPWTIWFMHGCVIAVFLIGMLCFFLRTSHLRQILGLKLMLQSISLGIITTGWENGKINLSQSMVITSLVIEAVIIGLALTLIIQMNRHQKFRQEENGH